MLVLLATKADEAGGVPGLAQLALATPHRLGPEGVAVLAGAVAERKVASELVGASAAASLPYESFALTTVRWR